MTFDIHDFLIKAYKAKASDVHLNCGKIPSLRINGEIFKVASDEITKDDLKEILHATLPEEYNQKEINSQDIDYIYEIPGVSRYRVNFCKDIFGGKLTFRSIPYNIKTPDELSLPPFLKSYTFLNNGIILVTGATGSGKSTTLASLIDIINKTRKRHIVTIEDPVEFVYTEKKSIITQRSLGLDVKDFKTGIKYALRQDPDVILVGEIRDKETLYSAIEAAETGHLVFSTIHTNDTVQTVNRLKGFIDEVYQEQFTERLANCIRGIIHQQLVPTVNNGELVPAVEILTFTPTVTDYVKNGKLNNIINLMQISKQPDIVTMNNALLSLYNKKMITKEVAIEHSLNKNELIQMIKGIYHDTSMEDYTK